MIMIGMALVGLALSNLQHRRLFADLRDECSVFAMKNAPRLDVSRGAP